MLRSLLIERFRLKYRREIRQGPVYLLLKGSNALKLVDSKDKNAYPWAGGIHGGMIIGDGLAGISPRNGSWTIKSLPKWLKSLELSTAPRLTLWVTTARAAILRERFNVIDPRKPIENVGGKWLALFRIGSPQRDAAGVGVVTLRE